MVNMRIKSMFFDAPKVKNAVDRAKRRALSKGGAFIRRSAKSSIRKRKAEAQPGKPPSSHEGSLKRLIFFGYDEVTDSTVVGPVPFKGKAAPLIEFGGTIRTKRRRFVPVGKVGRGAGGKFTKRKLRRVPAGTRMTYQPHPYMAPALEKNKQVLPKVWANSIRGG